MEHSHHEEAAKLHTEAGEHATEASKKHAEKRTA
jgi:hypothetical protein